MIFKRLNHIQVLRAISVLFVFFYHLKNQAFTNGYLGVDMFFVISGFVITLKLYEDYTIEKKINIKNFFIKRFKRIYPVLLIFLLTTLLLIIFLSPTDLFLDRFKTFISAVFGISNLYYLIETKDYFDTVFGDPLHHTWSLGVEEQFYIIYPFLLYLFFSLTNGKIFRILLIFTTLTILGGYLSYFYSENKIMIFYFSLFRFWQFFFGATIFFLLLRYKQNIPFISIISFLIIFIIIFSNNHLNNFNRIFLITFFSGIFILYYNKDTFLNFFFDNKYLIYLGNISYSFYLWHLPIIYFYDFYFVESFFRLPLIFILTTIISSISYEHIEQKFRYYKFGNLFLKKNYYIIFFIIIILMSLIYFISNKKSYDNQFKKIVKEVILKVNYLERKFNYSNRTVFYKVSINNNEIYRFCTATSKDYSLNKLNLKIECLKNNTTNKLFYLEGDSHTANFVSMFNTSKFVENFYYAHSKKNYINFDKINELSNNYNTFYYVKAINTYEEVSFFKNNLSKFKKNIKILIIGPIPSISDEDNIKPLKCLVQKIDCFIDAASNKKKYESINNEIKSLASFKNIYFYEPYDGLCSNDKCYVYNSKNDLLTHRDNTHLTIEGSNSLTLHFFDYYKNHLIK